jgi:general secretion pathway protein N
MTDKRRILRWTGYAALALVFLLLFLVYQIPANWLATAAARMSEGVVRIQAPIGTIWSGQGELHVGAPASTPQHLGTLRWRLNPLWLLAARAQLSLDLSGAAVNATALARVSPRKYLVRNLKASFPVHLVSLAYAPAAFFEPTGTMDVRADDLELSAKGLTGLTEATWRGAGGRFTEGALGDYRFELKGNGEVANLSLSTLSGRLRLDGQGKWEIAGDGNLQFAGNATPTDPALEPLLKPVGPDLGNGRRALRFSARLPLVKQLGL